jgi:hypothetical protein
LSPKVDADVDGPELHGVQRLEEAEKDFGLRVVEVGGCPPVHTIGRGTESG